MEKAIKEYETKQSQSKVLLNESEAIIRLKKMLCPINAKKANQVIKAFAIEGMKERSCQVLLYELDDAIRQNLEMFDTKGGQLTMLDIESILSPERLLVLQENMSEYSGIFNSLMDKEQKTFDINHRKLEQAAKKNREKASAPGFIEELMKKSPEEKISHYKTSKFMLIESEAYEKTAKVLKARCVVFLMQTAKEMGAMPAEHFATSSAISVIGMEKTL